MKIKKNGAWENFILQVSVPTMKGASSTSDGTKGLVPQPSLGDQNKYLKADGTWGIPTNTNTDTKVTNTLNNNTTFYLTGTTSSATNTGTQVFNSNIYYDTGSGYLRSHDGFVADDNSGKYTEIYTDGLDCYDSSSDARLSICPGAIRFIRNGVNGSITPSSYSGNAATATKATQDSAGQQINTTYIKGLSVSGKTITYTKGDGTTGTITTQDTNTTYSAGTGISLSGTTFSNAGVRSIASGSTNGTISVNTGGTSAEVAVKGLGSAAYTASSAYAAASHTHSDYVQTSDVANSANKIPRYNADGHLVLPNGSEFWIA